jgi:hypothetical protein
MSSDYARFAMPIEGWYQEPDTPYPVFNNSLLVLDMDREMSRPELRIHRSIDITPDETDTYVWAGEDRSVLIGNDIYYLHGDQIWYMPAGEGAELQGPY